MRTINTSTDLPVSYSREIFSIRLSYKLISITYGRELNISYSMKLNIPYGREICLIYGSDLTDFMSCERPPNMAISSRPTSWLAGLDKIRSSDWSKVGMLYRRGGHWGRWVWRDRHMLQHECQTNKEMPSWAMPHSNFLFCPCRWVHTTSCMGFMIFL